MPSANKYHWWFDLILDPRYVNEFTNVKKLHEIDTIDIRTIINKMIPKFHDYIVVVELEETPYTSPLAVTTGNLSLYFNEDTLGVPRTDSKGGNILIERIESEFEVFCNA